MKPQFDPVKRQVPTTGDNLQLYRARIYKKMPPGDDRLQIRVMPFLADLPNPDRFLPKWPPFFQGQVITGKTEADVGQLADYVWVAALPDFSVGYVMGLATGYGRAYEVFQDSINFTSVLQGLINRGVASSDLRYENIQVLHRSANHLDMVDTVTGDRFTLLSNGTVFSVLRNQIYMRVGTPDSGRTDFSAIRISREEISFATPTFRVKSANIVLGDKGLNVLATPTDFATTVEGTSHVPQTGITV